MITLEQLRLWCNGTLISNESEGQVAILITDSRKIRRPERALFIALDTDQRDGHQFVRDAWQKGVRMFLVSKKADYSSFHQSSFILVDNTLQALQSIAVGVRNTFDIPVIGITGSNGKTVVKEWLGQLLSEKYRVLRSPLSYNSQIGVPLSIWQLNDSHELAIFEAGISKPGEMEKLERMIQPEWGIFTNIGEAHSEGFPDIRVKIQEKLTLFHHSKYLIYCADYQLVDEQIKDFAYQLHQDFGRKIQLITWARTRKDADLVIENIIEEDASTRIDATFRGERLSIAVPFTDTASVENALHCCCTLFALGIASSEIISMMQHLQPIAMRMELRHGINDCTIINDAYNSDLTSIGVALDFLLQQRQHQKHTVILSDILQSGKPELELYQEVAEAIRRRGINRFVGVGYAILRYKHLFEQGMETRFFLSVDELLQHIDELDFSDEAILLKGARSFGFERVSTRLELGIHQTVLKVNLSAIVNNFNTYRQIISNDVKMMAMVKAFSYGSGSHEIARSLEYAGVDYLGVAYTEEGVDLRRNGINVPIMVMSPDMGSFDRMISWKLEPEIFNFRSLEHFLRVAANRKVEAYPIHIKLDTGMHRLGFLPHEADELIQKLRLNKEIKVASIFSHLAGSDSEYHDGFTKTQAKVFEEVSRKIIDGLGYTPMRHLCNSAAIARHPNLHYDMVRLGLGLYGMDDSGFLDSRLQEAGTLTTTVAQIKEIPAGDTIGYNRMGVAERKTKLAIINIGYADGYPRSLGNGKGYVLIHDKPASIVGSVCMDMCMVDITDIPEVEEGDEAIVFGPSLSPRQLAKWAGTIPYEIMTGISQRVKRVYLNEM